MTNPPTPAPGYWTRNTAPRLGTSPRAPVNYMAWTGLVVSVSGFLIPLGINGVLGVIFSMLGLRDARRFAAAGHEQTGRQLAIAGIITGIANIVATAAIIVLLILAFFWFTDWLNTLITTAQNPSI